MPEIHFISFIALAFSLGYMFFILYLLRHPDPLRKELSGFPKISILVAFRNEEENLAACCDALLQLNYPSDKLEILFLNDQSTDSSAQIVDKYIADEKLFKRIDIESDKNNLSGKMNALAQGMDLVSGEFIFITDADCTPHPNWLKTMLPYFTEHVAMVSGFTILETRNQAKAKLFDELQIADMIFLQGLAFASSNIGRPITVIGNNLAFRKNVYDSLGGFKSIGFSITEDHALMKAILDKTDYKVKYIRDLNGPVFSYPVDGFKLFIEQRTRWIKGGLKGSPFAFVVVGFSFLVHVSIIALFALQQWNTVSATAIGLIVGIDYFVYRLNLKALLLSNLKKHFVKYEVFYILYTLLLFVVFPFMRKINWKGRRY